jgi:hypothetical protein
MADIVVIGAEAGKTRGTRPDVPVETTADNLLRGIDEQLDAALKLVETAEPPNP